MPIRGVLAGLLMTLAMAFGAEPDATYTSLRTAAPAEAYVVENIVLRRDAGTLTLKSGAIAFTPAVQGRDTVAVFVGEGEFSLAPVSGIEKSYLKSLTEQETVKDTFDRALFCFTDDTGKEIRAQAKTRAAEAKLADALHDFRKKLRAPAAPDNLEAELLMDLYRPAQAGFFRAYLHGRKRSDLQFQVRPRGAIPELGPEEVMVYSALSGQRDEILYLSHFRPEVEKGTASSEEEKRPVAAVSYQIETAIAKNDRFTASTRLTFKALEAGERVIRVDLLPTLRVSRVAEGDREVPFIQENKNDDSAFYVVMPKAMEAGSTHELVIEYQGDKVVRKEGGGNFSVGARESWYPNLNSFHDHAQYDLTFKVPKDYTLVSVGKPVKAWVEKDLACSRWTSEVPLAVAGFNYGLFKKKQASDAQSGMELEGYATTEAPEYLREASNGTPMAPSQLIDRTLAEAQMATRIFNNFFGKTDFSRIAITQQPEFNFGQSWPTLVYLPLSAYLDSTQRWKLMGIQSSLTQFVEEVTAHEVSHQWWGHMVGWATHHDQWLSEGFAEFSAGLFLQYTQKTPAKYLQYWTHARDRLMEKNSFGRRANDAGPLWLGLRLSSEKNAGAYSGLVYGKGGYVLHMLRQMMFDPQKDGDKAFIAMMQDFVQQYRNRNATTEGFQRVVEKHMRPNMDIEGNGKMDWFFREWVYGTTIPKYKFDYTLTPQADGKVLLKATLTQSEVPNDFVMVVPMYLDFDGTIVRMGVVRAAGNTSVPVEAMLPKKPTRALLNAWHDVLEQQ